MLCYHLSSLKEHMTYEAEVVGAIIAAHLMIAKVEGKEKGRAEVKGKGKGPNGKGKAVMKLIEQQKSSNIIKVGGVIFLLSRVVKAQSQPEPSSGGVQSLISDYILHGSPKLPLDQVQLLAQYHLAVLRPKDGIVFSQSASFAEIEVKLEDLFPELFAYFETLPIYLNSDENSNDPFHAFMPHWKLCHKSHQTIHLSPVIWPTVTMKPIPKSIMDQFKEGNYAGPRATATAISSSISHLSASSESLPSLDALMRQPGTTGNKESLIKLTDSDNDDGSGTYQAPQSTSAGALLPLRLITRAVIFVENDLEAEEFSQAFAKSFSFGPNLSSLDNPWTDKQDLGF
ncbi:hypothetical protein AN958_02594 [Leucoagaricus sp. SymC.cos]|nr:hypothetical protein AN958_02594 [Leucoagaricus sp. SymC.cos]